MTVVSVCDGGVTVVSVCDGGVTVIPACRGIARPEGGGGGTEAGVCGGDDGG